MSRPRGMCKLCWVRKATRPDRDKPGAWRAEVCAECHAGRLVGDLEKIIAALPPETKPTNGATDEA